MATDTVHFREGEIKIGRPGKYALQLDSTLARVGLGLSMNIVAWALAKSMYSRVGDRWERVPLNTSEVLDDAACR